MGTQFEPNLVGVVQRNRFPGGVLVHPILEGSRSCTFYLIRMDKNRSGQHAYSENEGALSLSAPCPKHQKGYANLERRSVLVRNYSDLVSLHSFPGRETLLNIFVQDW